MRNLAWRDTDCSVEIFRPRDGVTARIVAMPEEYPIEPEPHSQDAQRNRAMRDVWERTLSKISSLFGRIAYLASLRNENTGKYEHFGLSQIYSEEDAHRVLEESHEASFREWLAYPLEPQKRDLEAYLKSLETETRTVLDAWATVAPYRQLTPARATRAERELYLSDLELILSLLRSEISSSP